MNEKNLKENDSKEIFLNIIDKEKENGLSEEIHIKAKENFLKRYEKLILINIILKILLKRVVMLFIIGHQLQMN